MYINEDHILIRDFKENDIKNKIEWINDPRNNAFLHYDIPLNYKDTLNLEDGNGNKTKVVLLLGQSNASGCSYNDYLQNTLNEEYIPDIYLDREHLYSTWDKGYIYIITKKSTGEFYVGQTNIVPIFRWGQHLKTARFPIENLVDYKFEVLEEVSDKHLLLNREAYWINKMHDQNPELCLNKNLPKFEQK